jgi:hypothetical protein
VLSHLIPVTTITTVSSSFGRGFLWTTIKKIALELRVNSTSPTLLRLCRVEAGSGNLLRTSNKSPFIHAIRTVGNSHVLLSPLGMLVSLNASQQPSSFLVPSVQHLSPHSERLHNTLYTSTSPFRRVFRMSTTKFPQFLFVRSSHSHISLSALNSVSSGHQDIEFFPIPPPSGAHLLTFHFCINFSFVGSSLYSLCFHISSLSLDCHRHPLQVLFRWIFPLNSILFC